jgi:ubiquinone/menaquinone biosynthesis C-methylase UbiE
MPGLLESLLSVVNQEFSFMDHRDHVNLLRNGIPNATDQVWADLGSGGGAFALALAELLGPTGQIYSVDKNQRSLKEQEQAMSRQFPATKVQYRVGDFTQPLDLPLLDGIVMANSLHFVTDKQKEGVIKMVQSYLRPGGRLVLVEYNTDQGNTWVPYPMSYKTWERFAGRMGFAETRQISIRGSSFLHEIYSALSY